MHVGSRTRASMPRARAERAMAPRFSGSLSPSSTAMRRAPAIASAIDGQRPAVGGGDRAAVEVEADGRRQHGLAARRRPGRRAPSRRPAKRASDLRRDEHRADPVPRLEQPLDRRDALGDEQLVALAAAPGRGIGQLEVVGEAGIGGIVDRTRARPQSDRLDRRPTTARTSNTCLRTHVPCTCRGRCSASTSRPSTRRSPALRRIELDDRTWLEHLPGLAGRPRAGLRPPLPRPRLAAAHGHDVRAPAARAAADGVVGAEPRARGAARAGRDPHGC